MAVSLIPLMLTGLGFAGLFVVVPNRDVLWRDALVGGFVTAIVLEIMKSAFAYYLTRFPTYTIIYGAFATLPIFLLWIYLSWLAVLLGATLAASAPLIRLGRWEINRYPGAAYVDALDALRAAPRPGRQPARPDGQRPGQAVAAAPGRAERRARNPERHGPDRAQHGRQLDTGLRRPPDLDGAVVERFLLDQTRPRVRNDAEILRVAASVLGPAGAHAGRSVPRSAKYRK